MDIGHHISFTVQAGKWDHTGHCPFAILVLPHSAKGPQQLLLSMTDYCDSQNEMLENDNDVPCIWLIFLDHSFSVYTWYMKHIHICPTYLILLSDALGYVSWLFRLDPTPAGGPYSITVTLGGSTLTLHNVLFGDIWLCAGQSNMEFQISKVRKL